MIGRGLAVALLASAPALAQMAPPDRVACALAGTCGQAPPTPAAPPASATPPREQARPVLPTLAPTPFTRRPGDDLRPGSLSREEAQTFNARLAECWVAPTPQFNVRPTQLVGTRLVIDHTGTITSVLPSDPDRFGGIQVTGDPLFQAVRAALLQPRCANLAAMGLPADTIRRMRYMTTVFSPRGLVP